MGPGNRGMVETPEAELAQVQSANPRSAIELGVSSQGRAGKPRPLGLNLGA
jgi:hypothetical protein